MKLQATQETTLADGRKLKAGEVFDTSPAEAEELVRQGVARVRSQRAPTETK